MPINKFSSLWQKLVGPPKVAPEEPNNTDQKVTNVAKKRPILPGEGKFSSSNIVPINESPPSTAPLSPTSDIASQGEGISPEGIDLKKVPVDERMKQMQQLSERAHRVKLKKGETIETATQSARGDISRIKVGLAHVKAKKVGLSWETHFQELKKLDQSEAQLKHDFLVKIKKLHLLEELSEVESNTIADDRFPFEDEYDELIKEATAIDTLLAEPFDRDNPIDRAKHSLLIVRKEEIKLDRLSLLNRCSEAAHQDPKEMETLEKRIKSIEKEHEEFHSAFTAVYPTVLRALKKTFEQRSANAKQTIDSLRKELSSQRAFSETKLKEVQASSKVTWNGACEKLQKLPKEKKEQLIAKLRDQHCDPVMVQEVKAFLFKKHPLHIESYLDKLYLLEQAKEFI